MTKLICSNEYDWNLMSITEKKIFLQRLTFYKRLFDLSSNHNQKLRAICWLTLNWIKWGIIIWLIQHDRINMTEKFLHDQKDHTNKHLPFEHDRKSMTENKIHHITETCSLVPETNPTHLSQRNGKYWYCCCSSVWIFLSQIPTHFWSYWFGQNN